VPRRAAPPCFFAGRGAVGTAKVLRSCARCHSCYHLAKQIIVYLLMAPQPAPIS
jgi:hypothetical protein